MNFCVDIFILFLVTNIENFVGYLFYNNRSGRRARFFEVMKTFEGVWGEDWKIFLPVLGFRDRHVGGCCVLLRDARGFRFRRIRSSTELIVAND